MVRRRIFWQTVKAELVIWRVGALPGLLIIAGITIARFTGALQFLEWAAFDTGLRLRPPESLDERLTIVGITETDIQKIGRYPIPDSEIAALLKTLQTYQPAVIGLDLFRDLPIGPRTELAAIFQANRKVIGIEQALPAQDSSTIAPPPELPLAQIGFVDAILDQDGSLRRSLLGTPNSQGDYRFSLTLRLAETYLDTRGITLENGLRDSEAMRFGTLELARFQPNTGSYIRADAGGNQILLNFRSGSRPFRILSLTQIQQGNFRPEWIRDRIVLIGITSLGVKDFVNTRAIVSRNPGLVNGVEIQAHATSQLVNAVLDGRPLLNTWPEAGEYGWIITWGLLGIGVGRFLRSPWQILLVVISTSVGLVMLSYLLLLAGWWIPLIPALLALMLNGAGLTATLFYRSELDLRSRLQDRQLVIEQTFNTIHNGPLQTLSTLLRQVHTQPPSTEQLLAELQNLNQELRSVYETMQQETRSWESFVHLGSDRILNLQAPLQEILYEIYCNTLQRDLPCFATIKVKVVNFDPLNDDSLNSEQKRGLCRFLEEALCNVGKHAKGATQLTVTCSQHQGKQIIRIADNGIGLPADSSAHPELSVPVGLGTQHAVNLARRLGGQFQRLPNQPQGTVCELTWFATKSWFWPN